MLRTTEIHLGYVISFLRFDEPLSSSGISKSISEGIIEEEEEEEEEDGESNYKRKKEDDQEVTAVDLGPLYLRLCLISKDVC